MNIKKMSGSLVAATLLLGLNTVAMADCATVISDTEDLAAMLRCEVDVGTWDNNNAIWQWKGKGSMGCAVHRKLAKQLNEERDEYDSETMPPYKGAKNKNGNNVAAGAANDLRNGKFESALAHYQTFMDTIMYSAKVNTGFVATDDFASADAAAQFFFDEAYDLQQAAIQECAP